MDSRGKQRLTGAVILVALFVLLVPELLKGPEKSGTAPADDSGMRTHVIDVDSPANAAVEPAAPAPPVNLAQPTASTERAVPGEAAVPAPDDSADPAPVAQPRPAPTEARPTVAPEPAPQTHKPPAAGVAQPAPARPATPAGGQPRSFAVQLGSFSVRENADRLVREMTAKGFATFIQPTTTSGRQLYQVRVGPTRDRASAEALAAQLKRQGQSGSIVAIP